MDFLEDWTYNSVEIWQPVFREVTFSCSVKLKSSGEAADKAIIPEVVHQYQTIGNVYLKLVTDGSDDQIEEIQRVVGTYRDTGFIGKVYLMPVGGTYESYRSNATKVADLCLKHGYNFSPREHTFLWGNSWGT